MKTNPAIERTPGPWQAIGTGKINIVGHRNGQQTVLASINAGPPYESVALADARLIAAAPELLEALILCVTEGAPDSNRERAEIAHKQARAAIAKATGEQ